MIERFLYRAKEIDYTSVQSSFATRSLENINRNV